MVVLPTAAAVAKPALLMVATEVFDELHVTVLVRFCVLLSLYVPVAVYCRVAPFWMEAFAGVTAIDANTGAVTVSPVDPLIDPETA